MNIFPILNKWNITSDILIKKKFYGHCDKRPINKIIHSGKLAIQYFIRLTLNSFPMEHYKRKKWHSIQLQCRLVCKFNFLNGRVGWLNNISLQFVIVEFVCGKLARKKPTNSTTAIKMMTTTTTITIAKKSSRYPTRNMLAATFCAECCCY